MSNPLAHLASAQPTNGTNNALEGDLGGALADNYYEEQKGDGEGYANFDDGDNYEYGDGQ